MSILRLSPIDRDTSIQFSCGVNSIDEMVSNAYAKTLFRQAIAYNVYCDDEVVGSCMLQVTTIHEKDEDYFVGEPVFAAYEIPYIAIDKRYQRNKIGSYVLETLLSLIKERSKVNPIRFIIIEAFPELKDWYTAYNFKPFEMFIRASYDNKILMRIDLISSEDAKRIEEYCEQLY